MRFFANDNNMNFNDYNRYLKGKEMYKDIATRGSNYREKNYNIVNDEITNFLDYATFLNLTRTFYKYNESEHSHKQHCVHAPLSIHDSQHSFLHYNQLLSHIKDCDYCCRCKNITDAYQCDDFKNHLYPYGNINKEKGFLKFPAKLNLNCKEGEDCSCESEKSSKPEAEPCKTKQCHNKCCKPPEKYVCNKKEDSVYPSQHQFMYYKPDINEDAEECSKEKRIKAYSIYPQMDKNKCIKPVLCTPRGNTCGNTATNPLPCGPLPCSPMPCGKPYSRDAYGKNSDLIANAKPIFIKKPLPPPPYGICYRSIHRTPRSTPCMRM
jgi:hypothetical protein